ncbi:MAG: aldo/keto reductase, partial [Lachnospiraceae bacterium]
MQTVTLGKTGLTVSKNGFGALPIQRISKKDAVYLLQKAFYHGINYFDTARWYTDSEEKMGAAFAYTRDKIIISTKTGAGNAEQFWKDLDTSLTMLQTDYIDIYQFHNPAFCPKPGE